jgi:hypothetical protein
VIRTVAVVAVLTGLCACAPRYLHSTTAPDAALYGLERLLVMPVTADAEARGADAYRTGVVAAGAEATVTDALYGALLQETAFELVERALAERPAPPSDLPALQALARALKADAVLRGVVSAYREREGSHVGVERPAAVGIDLWLIAARDGRTLWHGRYYETQQSMTEELRTVSLYLKRGTRWLTAAELAKYAVGELVKTLPRPHAERAAEGPK